MKKKTYSDFVKYEQKKKERQLDKKGVKKILIRSVTEQQKNCCNSTNIGMRLILEYGIGLLQGPRYVLTHISKINGFSLVHVYYLIRGSSCLFVVKQAVACKENVLLCSILCYVFRSCQLDKEYYYKCLENYLEQFLNLLQFRKVKDDLFTQQNFKSILPL